MSKKIGLFGGTFNPIHYGHINSIDSVINKMGFDSIRVIPAYQAPGKDFIEKPTPEDRLKLVEMGLFDYKDKVQVDRSELDRQGVSYSLDTLRDIIKKEPDKNFYLIIGLDQFQNFDKWKEYSEILNLSNLVVTSRPGYNFPHEIADFPEGLKEHIQDFDSYTAVLKNEKQINFLRLTDFDMSSSDIRKKVRLNQSINKYVPIEVETYILENKLYSAEESVDYDSNDLMSEVKKFVTDFGGINPISFDMRNENQITDFNLVASSQSKRGNLMLAENVIEKVKSSLGVKPFAIDGKEDANWIVVDYGSLILHFFYETLRYEYNLEALWKDFPKI